MGKEKLIFKEDIKDVEDLFKENNFLYSIIQKCDEYTDISKKWKIKKTNDIKMNVALENKYQNYTNQKDENGKYIHNDWLIHNTNYAIEKKRGKKD